jgi:hypothetical protein
MIGLYKNEEEIKKTYCPDKYSAGQELGEYDHLIKCTGSKCPMLRRYAEIICQRGVEGVYCGKGGKP